MGKLRLLLIVLAFPVGVLSLDTLSVARGDEGSALVMESYDTPTSLHTTHLPNAVLVHPKVISGGLPDGEHAFRELRSLNVKTIISVDGMKPDVKTARRFGLRYVHLPHGYDGVPVQRAKELAKAIQSFDGPVYIHCHHGKHRSPAAASVACVGAGLLPQAKALAVLELAGTSSNYRGLFESVRNARPLETALLQTLSVDFSEVVKVPPMAEAMVAIGHTHEHLKLIADAGWKSPVVHPDLDPAHEALLMLEHYGSSRELKKFAKSHPSSRRTFATPKRQPPN